MKLRNKMGFAILLALGVAGSVVALIFNPVFALLMCPSVASCALAFRAPKAGMRLALVWLVFSDFCKRLLLVAPTASRAEWWGLVAVPDLVIACLAGRLFWEIRARRGLRWKRSSLDLPIVAFLAWCSLEVFNPSTRLPVGMAGFKLVGPYILFYFIGAALLRDEEEVKRLWAFVVTLGVIASLYGVWQSVAGMMPFERRWLWEGYTDLGEPVLLQYGVLRVFSTFSDPHAYGFYLASAILFLSGLHFSHPPGEGRVKHLVQGLIMVIGLVLSLARAPWAILAVGALAMYLRSKPRVHWWRSVLALALIVAVSVGPFLLQGHVSGLQPFLRRALTTGTYEARVRAWKAFLTDPDLRRPLGHGMGMASYARRKFTGEQGPTPHNQLLAVLYETGWVGVALFVWVFVRAFRLISRIGKFPSRTRLLLLPFVGVVIGTTYVGVALMNFWDSRTAATFFWLSLGGIAALCPE